MTDQNAASYRITLFLTLITVSIILVDRPLAIFIQHHLGFLKLPFHKIIVGIEFLSGFAISKYLVGIIVLCVGLVLLAKDRNSQRANIFFFIGSALVLSRLVAGLLKNVFDRSRPYVFVNDNSVNDFFYTGGSSFPSGHAAHFFGLFLPLIVLFPRYKWALLIIPVFVAVQRVIANDHYISDILGGVLIAMLFTYIFQQLFKIQPLQPLKSSI